MRKNLDKDIVEFNIETENIDNSMYEEELPAPKGIKCKDCVADGYKFDDALIGSVFCTRCKYCYGAKIRYCSDASTNTFSGYVKCSKNNRNLGNILKGLLWHMGISHLPVKNLNNKQ